MDEGTLGYHQPGHTDQAQPLEVATTVQVNAMAVLVAQGRLIRSVTVTGTKNLLKPLQVILAGADLAAR